MPRSSRSSAPNLAALGHEVARVRQARGWSIDALADAAGVGRRTILNIEAAAKVPRIDTLYAVATALDIPLAELVVSLDPQ